MIRFVLNCRNMEATLSPKGRILFAYWVSEGSFTTCYELLA